jgi:hypothetical protein
MLVRSFNLKPSALLLLLGLLTVITLIVVLPDIDPLDTAFQRNTSPLALRAGSIAKPQMSLASSVFACVISPNMRVARERRVQPARMLLNEPLEILIRSFRC